MANGFDFNDPEFRLWVNGMLHDGTLTVTFNKKDGTERVMNCTLNENVVVPHENKTERVKKKNDDAVAVWDIDKCEWRSFRWDSITNLYFTIGNE